MSFDSRFPWKLHKPLWKFPSYACTMSNTEWKVLLACATRGDSEAEWKVAELYEDGCRDKRKRILIKRSAREAAKWLRRAAEHGCAPAQDALGVLLGNKDWQEALQWHKRSFHTNETDCAAYNIAITYREHGNMRRAVYWFLKAVALGDDSARVQLGIHYYWGKGIRKNSAAAVRCFRKATKGKNISEADRDDAYFYLGVMYFEGTGVKKSFATARTLFQRANRDGNHPVALEMLQELS